MKLQRQKTRIFHGKEYYRYAVVIPQSEIEKLGWKDGLELEPKAQGKRLIIEPSIENVKRASLEKRDD